MKNYSSFEEEFDDIRRQEQLRREYSEERRREKEKRAQKELRLKKLRKKRRNKLVFSAVFIVFVLGFVAQAFFGGNPLKNLDSDSPFVAGRDRADDVLTVLIGVTDEGGLRTDALMLASYDRANDTVNLLNIPRDTRCNATTQSKKINAAFILGVDKTKEMVYDITGIYADKYVVVSLDGLADIIDVVGGVEVDVPFRMKYDDASQNLHIDIKAGTQVLDGENAVDFLRWRQNNSGISPAGYATGDLGRIENTQKFIDTLTDQVLSASSILKLPSIITSAFSSIDTDFKLNELLWIATGGLSIETESYTIPGVAKTIGGGSYYVVNESETLVLINEKFNPYTEEITELNLMS